MYILVTKSFVSNLIKLYKEDIYDVEVYFANLNLIYEPVGHQKPIQTCRQWLLKITKMKHCSFDGIYNFLLMV